jgi:enamine deaminase RidA (YjgF/YER057c/UK114 family)
MTNYQHRRNAEFVKEMQASEPILPGWQKRVIEESRELCDRLDKLQSFMDSGKDFKMLSFDDRVLLELQYNYMAALSHVLARRIDRFNLPPETAVGTEQLPSGDER